MYRVEVPRDYWNQEMEDKVKWAPPDTFLNTGRALLGCAIDGYYEEPIWITAVNNTYSVHPGSSRYILNRVDFSMPTLYGIIVNRYGTSKQMIADTFKCDPELYEESFIGYWAHKNNPSKSNVGHNFKPYRTVNKSEFDVQVMTTDDVVIGGLRNIRFTHQGRHLIDFGLPQKQILEKEVANMTEFGEVLLKYFI